MARRCVVFDGLAVITGGQVTRAKAFLRRFRTYDPASRMIVLKSHGNWIEVDAESDLEVVVVSLPQGRWRALGRMVWQNLSLPRLLTSMGADVYLSFSHYLPRTMPRRVMTIMGVANFAPFSDLAKEAEVAMSGRLRLTLLKATILRSARQARTVIALSDALRRSLLACGVDAGKVAVIPNGVDVPAGVATKDEDPCLAQFGVHGQFLLYVSHFYRYKNFARLVQAYARLSKDMKERYALVLIGEPHDRAYYREVVSLIAGMGLAGRVVVIPGLSAAQLAPFYQATALFLFFSLVENSPNILLEAMAHGAPVLASRIEPMPEFGQEAVQYVDPLDVPAMTQAITRLLEDRPAREALGKRAPAQAAKFTWDDFTARVVALYATV